MREILLEGADWRSEEDFYSALLSHLCAPDWHGHNFDALWDSITRGDINQINPPFHIRITGIDVMPAECKGLVSQFVAILSDARGEGSPIVIDVG